MEDAPISGNLDAPEGGFDAIMQAIACGVSEYVNFFIIGTVFVVAIQPCYHLSLISPNKQSTETLQLQWFLSS